MFTSRAEYRLLLRSDNADQRLTPLGLALGCVGAERQTAFREKAKALTRAREILEARQVTPHEANAHGIAINQDGRRRSGMELLAFKDVNFGWLISLWPELASVPAEISAQLEIEAHYASYLSRQEADIKAYRRGGGVGLPKKMNYYQNSGVLDEGRGEVKGHGAGPLGAAGRNPGGTPAGGAGLLGAGGGKRAGAYTHLAPPAKREGGKMGGGGLIKKKKKHRHKRNNT